LAEIKTIAVIGAGIMGRGIAHVAALGGYRTILEDLTPAALRKAESEIRTNLDKAVELKKVSSDDAHAAFSRLEYAGSAGSRSGDRGRSRRDGIEDRDFHSAR
jgi:3-hydroxybutyryl-CoA dehydrogenase